MDTLLPILSPGTGRLWICASAKRADKVMLRLRSGLPAQGIATGNTPDDARISSQV
jgi:hypothetical protein